MWHPLPSRRLRFLLDIGNAIFRFDDRYDIRYIRTPDIIFNNVLSTQALQFLDAIHLVYTAGNERKLVTGYWIRSFRHVERINSNGCLPTQCPTLYAV